MEPAIRVENLGKRYRITRTGQRASYRTLRESLTEAVQAPFRRLFQRTSRARMEDYWALRDVSFEVPPGEVVGVIGSNGAGKSTLLKVLSRISEPTTGEVRLYGRVGSLLEVGTGFHPELSGRENVYLNGAVLGMTRREIDGKFDDIVNFAELEKFLDTPVKRYSSGMYMRLAFSVAAHIQPEILLVDEVLAVGDVAFQKKCIGKIGDVARGGRTVLFVSHQMDALLKLCPRSLLLEGGRVVAHGPTREVIETYFARQQALLGGSLAERNDRRGGQRFQFTGTWLEDSSGRRLPSAMAGQEVRLVATYRVAPEARVAPPQISFAIYTSEGVPVTAFVNLVAGAPFPEDYPRAGRIEVRIPRLFLNVGRYYYNLMALSGPEYEMEDWVPGAGSIQVESGDYWGTGRSIESKFIVQADHEWKVTGLEQGGGPLAFSPGGATVNSQG